MKKFIVTIPIAGSFSIEVEAENAKAAEQEAWTKIGEHKAGDVEEIGEVCWEYLRKICTGNVCHAPCHEISVEENYREPRIAVSSEPRPCEI